MLRILTRTKGEIEIKETNFLNCDAAQEKKNALTGEVGRWSENLFSLSEQDQGDQGCKQHDGGSAHEEPLQGMEGGAGDGHFRVGKIPAEVWTAPCGQGVLSLAQNDPPSICSGHGVSKTLGGWGNDFFAQLPQSFSPAAQALSSASLRHPLSSRPSRILAPGALTLRSDADLPRPLPPEVAKRMMVLPVKS